MALHSVMEALWAAAMGDAPCPALPEDPLAALALLARASGAEEQSLVRWDLDAEPDPYPNISLEPFPSPSDLVAANRVSGLVAYQLPWLQGFAFYVDPVPDEDQHHRAYLRDEECLPGSAWGAFPTLEAGLRWLLESTGEASQDIPTWDDAWERGPRSGAFVLEAVVEAALDHLWSSTADDEWPVSEVLPIEASIPRDASWPRRVALRCLAQLLAVRPVGLPEGATLEDLPAPQRSFCAHLLSLEAARDGTPPAWIRGLVDGTPSGSEARLTERARDWAVRYAAARGPGSA